jgi:NADH-quinone oxidoreductase subunit N
MLSLDLDAILPMLLVTLSALFTMLAEAFRKPGERPPMWLLGMIGLVAAGATSAYLWNRNTLGFGVIVADNFGLFVNFILVIVGVLTIMFSSAVVHRDGIPAGEYYSLILFSLVGMMMMASANDLLVVFIALEVLSLAVYVLTGIRRDLAGTEAAFKYFLLGAFSSAFFLYGIAFTYGVTGSTRLNEVGAFFAAQALSGNPMTLIAVGLLLVGFAFKISAVPFHMWTPDAYEGAPAVVTGFMSTGVKVAAFAAFVRVFLSALEPFKNDWIPMVAALAALTMILGTVVGVAQSNLKRMLGYSSIAHGGYLLVALVAANELGKQAILFYLLSYALTNLAAFGVIALLGTRDRNNDDLRDYAGLWHTRPGVAALMTVALLSLGGLPPTAGFFAKYYIFIAAVSAGYYGLAIIGVLTSVVSVFFYLRVVVKMYMYEPDTRTAPPRVSGMGVAALAIAIVAIFYLGILPTPIINLASESIATIF